MRQKYSSVELERLWDNFLALWPLERLEAITLLEYASQGTNESFVYWLETGTEKLGSIYGGSAFKFGIYARKDASEREDGRGRCYSPEYGWLAKYGDSPAEAFSSVRHEIIMVAKAARAGDLKHIQQSNLGEAVSWKIAFLYQNRDRRTILPIYSGAMLAVLAGQGPLSDRQVAHQTLLQNQGSQDFFDFAQNLWQEADGKLAQIFTPEQAQEYFDVSDDLRPIKPATQYIAGYEFTSGKQIALVRQNKKVTLFLSAGDWVERVKSDVSSLKNYGAADARNSNLGANAPDLGIGKPIVCLVVESLSILEKVCAAYGGSLLTPSEPNKINRPSEEDTMLFPLNQILYGPPGTGKTYATTEKAVAIAEPEAYQAIIAERSEPEQRKAIKSLYDQLVESNRIAFTTFHQSFSYEDFVEGIRAEARDGQITYQIEDGVFKTLSQLADSAVNTDSLVTDDIVLEGRRIWKMSLGNTLKGEIEAYDDCIENHYIGLGWGGDIDFGACRDRKSVQLKYSAATGEQYDSNSYNVSAVNTFKNIIQNGDLIIVSDGNHKFRAIGEVTGDYQYSLDSDGRYFNQVRKARWLRVFEKSIPKEALFNKSLSQMTLYELRPHTIKLEKLREYLAKPKATKASADNYVLIIDEINRGNISRIFGELITLLEPDKRKGGADERSVILPYSKEPFSVASNLYVLGTMNTADKSLAQLDLALRRRFEFKELMPNEKLLNGFYVHGVDVGELLAVMNQRIEVLLDRDHLLGHAYFWPLLGLEMEAERQSLLAEIFEKRIIPLLQEYFFTDWERIGWVLNDPQKKLQDQFIQVGNVGRPLEGLFPPTIACELTDRRYQINTNAFTNPEAYRGILSRVGAVT